MYNINYKKLAKIVVEYSLEIKKGHQVFIIGPSFAEELFQALYVEIIKVGAHLMYYPRLQGMRELFFKYASDEQLLFVDDGEKVMFEKFDHLIEIRADYNTRKYSGVDPEKMARFSAAPERVKIMEIFEDRVARGEMSWVIVPFPYHANAQEANMDLFSYSDFVFKSLYLDKDSPIDEWRNMKKNQEKIVDYLNKVEKIHVIGEDTDLTLNVKGRKWINCCGQENLPDGEIFTSPIEDSANGHIRFTYPGIYYGREIEDIYLEFKEGEVVTLTAKKGESLLKELIKIENANKVGEFAIGTNYGITRFTKNILFDEKLGGTLHLALGLGFEECGSNNKSVIHWDILKDMRVPGSKVIADEKVIYEEGKWII
ncbi:MAG: aminopeptidase [Promethearchaeota archaeon]|jgi:aminopeptidase